MKLPSSVRWLSLAQIGRVAFQFVGMAFIARLLGPKYIGEMAIVMAVATFALLVRDCGLSASIIQSKDANRGLVATAAWIALALGIFLCVVLVVLAGPVSQFYGEPVLASLLVMVAVSFPIAGFTVPIQALEERAGNFKVVALIELLGQFMGLLIAIILANTHLARFALAGQMLMSISVIALCYHAVASRIPWSSFEKKLLGPLLKNGMNLVGFGLVNYLYRNVDSLLIGKVYGASILGGYSIGYKLMLFPISNIATVSNRALVPFLSSVREDGDRVASTYLSSLGMIAFLATPIMATLWLTRGYFVEVVFGREWLPLLPEILAYLAPIGLLQSLGVASSSAYMAMGNFGGLFRLGLLSALVQVAGFLIGSSYSFDLFLQFYVVTSSMSLFLCFWSTSRLLNIRIVRVFEAISGPVVLSILSAVLVHWANSDLLAGLIERGGIPIVGQLCLLTILFGALYFSLSRFFIFDRYSLFLAFFSRKAT